MSDTSLEGPPRAREGKPIDQLLTESETKILWRYLHNDNEPCNFIMGWRQPDGKKKYVKSKQKRAETIIDWAWSSIGGNPKSNITFVPFAKNKAGFSRWGCFDFDAHDGNWERAYNFAVAARDLLLQQRHVVILEDSGGGYHLWAISREFLAVRVWALLLKDIAQTIGAPLQSGICEIFPQDSAGDGSGKGVRAPGTWNPHTDTVNHILSENVGPLLEALIPLSVNQSRSPSSHFTYTKRTNSFFNPSTTEEGLYGLWKERWSLDFGIKLPATRHNQLAKLVGEMFRQVGHDMARRIAEAQFTDSTVKMAAAKSEHLAEFEGLWAGMDKIFTRELSDQEKEVLAVLTTDHERDAFRIIHSFARLAQENGHHDFPVVMRSLAQRICVTLPGACNLRDRLIAKGTFVRTRVYQANKSASYYCWLLHGAESRHSPD